MGLRTQSRDSGRQLSDYALNAVFCTGVALVLYLTGVSPLWPAWLASMSIGLCTYGLFDLGEPRLERWLPAWVLPLVLLPAGVFLGMALGGLLIYGDPGRLLLMSPLLVGLSVMFAAAGWAIFSTRSRLSEQRVALAEAERARAAQAHELAAAELKLLQAQIEPHFLFNTLGNVVSLIRSEPAQAEAMLVALTRLLRRSLQQSRVQGSTLGEEFALLEDYLAIQSIRMGDRLRYQLELPPELAALSVPPLLLQPLVENAITHGIEPRPGPGSIRVEASCRDDGVRLEVADDGLGISDSADGRAQTAGSGTALQNLGARLRARYGESASCDLLERDTGGILAVVMLPCDGAGMIAAGPAARTEAGSVASTAARSAK